MGMNLYGYFEFLNCICRDGQGNVYFNELLYGCMKRLYGCNIINNSTEQIKIYLLRQVNKTFFNFKIGTIF